MIKSINKVFRILLAALMLSSAGFSSSDDINFIQGDSTCITIEKASPVSFASVQKNQNETKDLSQSNLITVLSEDFSEKSYLNSNRYNSDLKLRIIYTAFLTSHFSTST